MGRAINETGERLAAIPEDQRPGLVAFVIHTDGMENASSEFKPVQIKEMIERQSTEYNWQFTFLGANQDAFASAGDIGIQQSAAASYSTANTSKAFGASANNVSRMRLSAASGQSVQNTYTDEEREAMK